MNWKRDRSRHRVVRTPDEKVYHLLATIRYMAVDLMKDMDDGIMFTWEGHENPISQMNRILANAKNASESMKEFTTERRSARQRRDQGIRAELPLGYLDIELPKQPLNMTHDDWDQLEVTLPYPICSPPHRRTPCVRTKDAHLAFDECQACGEDVLLHLVLDARPPAKFAWYCRDCRIAINKDNSDDFDREVAELKQEMNSD